MGKATYSAEWRANVSREYLSGVASSYELSSIYNVGSKTIRRWAKRYKEQGINAFCRGYGNSSYSNELKLKCVEVYISGELSRDEIVAKYNLSGHSVLRDWIMKYNANRELKDYNPKREVYMAEARRKTTIEERKEIVSYCIKHNRNYKETASAYDVSYSQVYSWVKKYEACGKEGLIDNRGHNKTDDEVDELERLRRENLRLKRQLEESEMTVELLKKVKELEGM
jgi:transposase